MFYLYKISQLQTNLWNLIKQINTKKKKKKCIYKVGSETVQNYQTVWCS